VPSFGPACALHLGLCHCITWCTAATTTTALRRQPVDTYLNATPPQLARLARSTPHRYLLARILRVAAAFHSAGLSWHFKTATTQLRYLEGRGGETRQDRATARLSLMSFARCGPDTSPITCPNDTGDAFILPPPRTMPPSSRRTYYYVCLATFLAAFHAAAWRAHFAT